MTSLDWGVQWAIFWQVYDNEGPPANGHWLVKEDGSRTDYWDFFAGLLEANP